MKLKILLPEVMQRLESLKQAHSLIAELIKVEWRKREG